MTALRLSHAGTPCVLLDRATFPRDKVCGDALSGMVPTLLDRLDPAIMDRFRARYRPQDIYGLRFVHANGKRIDLPYYPDPKDDKGVAPGYVSKRIDFDNFLIEEVERRADIDFRPGIDVKTYEKIENGYRVTTKSGEVLTTNLLIDATGAHSQFSRKHAGLEKDVAHHAAAVRSYWKGVTGFHPDGFIEIHFVEAYMPGYLWIFPLPNGEANVGLGMRSDEVKKQGINLRAALDDIIASPQFRDRFAGAECIDPTIGYGLPLGSKDRVLSGDNFLLTGDAGHLIDPLSGEGIGNAAYSGIIAAELAVKCLAENRFDAEFLKDYDVRIERVLRGELRLSYKLQKMLQVKWLGNLIVGIIAGNPRVVEIISRMYTDSELREQLVKPGFWIRHFFGKFKKTPAPANH